MIVANAEHQPISMPTNPRPRISVIVPFYNEKENVVPLYERLVSVLPRLGKSYEMVFVDDGSIDGTPQILRELADRDSHVKAIELMRNFGQTAALMAAFDLSSGDIIVAMDGDGQNDPEDIPLLLAKLDEGYHVVSGWRRDRKDDKLFRLLPSGIANRLISWISGVRLHDFGCSLKAYRRSVISNVRLYGEMHRFIPIYTSWQGGRIAEIEVRHHPRLHGRSKYGLMRIFKVVLDVMLLKYFDRYLTRPIHLFGAISFFFFFAGFAVGTWTIWLKIFEGRSFIATPLPLLVVTLIIAGFMSLMFGIVAELMVRIYHEGQGKVTYIVRQIGDEGFKSTTNVHE